MRRIVPGWVKWPQMDFPLLVSLLLLIGFGLVVLYSASGQDMSVVYRQGTRLGVGLVAMLVLSQVPPHILRLWTPYLFALGMALLLATWFFGVGRSTSRWLDLGPFRFQPSEIMKLAVPMMVAWYLHPRRLPPDLLATLTSFAILLAPAVLIARQPDLGTALLVAVSGCFTLFLAGLPWRVILGSAGLAAAAAPALWYLMHEYQRNRIRTFLDPESDPLGSGWNIIQSKIAVGSGGVLGKGWLNGRAGSTAPSQTSNLFPSATRILSLLSCPRNSDCWAYCSCLLCTCSSPAAVCISPAWPGALMRDCWPAVSA